MLLIEAVSNRAAPIPLQVVLCLGVVTRVSELEDYNAASRCTGVGSRSAIKMESNQAGLVL